MFYAFRMISNSGITVQDTTDTKEQLKELSSHEMLVTMILNLNVLAYICITIPVLTVFVEHSLSQMKLIKTRLRNCIGDASLNY